MRVYKSLSELIAYEMLPLMDNPDGKPVRELLNSYDMVALVSKVVGTAVVKGTRYYLVDPKVLKEEPLQDLIDAYKLYEAVKDVPLVTGQCDACVARAAAEVLTRKGVVKLCAHHLRTTGAADSPETIVVIGGE